MPPWCSGEGMAGRGPEWDPLKHEIQDRGPSSWGTRALLAESRGSMCYVLGAPSAVPIRTFPGMAGPLLAPAAWILSLWSRTNSLASQKYVTHKIYLPTQVSHKLA